jgi:hypothetical protein
MGDEPQLVVPADGMNPRGGGVSGVGLAAPKRRLVPDNPNPGGVQQQRPAVGGG